MFQSCSNSWFKSTALHNSTALHISMVSINIKKTIKKWATKQTRNKARPQANAGARVQTHIGRLRARLPKDIVAHIKREKKLPKPSMTSCAAAAAALILTAATCDRKLMGVSSMQCKFNAWMSMIFAEMDGALGDPMDVDVVAIGCSYGCGW